MSPIHVSHYYPTLHPKLTVGAHAGRYSHTHRQHCGVLHHGGDLLRCHLVSHVPQLCTTFSLTPFHRTARLAILYSVIRIDPNPLTRTVWQAMQGCECNRNLTSLSSTAPPPRRHHLHLHPRLSHRTAILGTYAPTHNSHSLVLPCRRPFADVRTGMRTASDMEARSLPPMSAR